MPKLVNFDDGSTQRNCFRKFSEWLLWEDREKSKDPFGYYFHEYPGVYLLAHFDEEIPQGSADYTDPSVIYVGEASWLKRRWVQFEASAFDGEDGHSGGHSYRKKYREQSHRLCVAVLPIWFGSDNRRSLEDWTQAYRLYTERRIIWEITVARGGTHDLLNKK